jgi:hypothetical protein
MVPFSDNETIYEDKYFRSARLLNAHTKNTICIITDPGTNIIRAYLKTFEV